MTGHLIATLAFAIPAAGVWTWLLLDCARDRRAQRKTHRRN